ncbi:NAD-dependent epimerase/dehydratase family protein [Bacillus massilinigeriensis]|uniref:NAD-dependent epimerase/dehydratase family protein n=1 Tax=Bacillus massilionigeriensis TaxID=1805475 RepID=UPI00096B65C9|nr:NAD-dependent epimerase/dehydratase family protein [Bacillus massilionigeriensis]
MNGKTALIAGSTGLIGKELLQLLLNGSEYKQVIAIVRRTTHMTHPRLKEVEVDFNQLELFADYFAVDDVFCCLGTTIKKAKTKEAMYKVDVEYPLHMAKLAYEKEAKHFLIVSSMNANPNSSLWYPKMKGKLEQKLSKIPLESISIIRPSLLLGKRDEFRLGEQLAGVAFGGISFLFQGPLRKFRAIKGLTVAKAMYQIAQNSQKGKSIFPSEQLESIGAQL